VLVGVTLATAAAVLLELPLSHVKVRDNLFTVIELPSAENLVRLIDPALLSASLALACMASVETLPSATAVDHLHTGPRTRDNRELFPRESATRPAACWAPYP